MVKLITVDDTCVVSQIGSEYVYTSWYLEDGKFIVDNLKARKYEHLFKEETMHKCRHTSKPYDSFFDAYVSVLLAHDLKPSELSMMMVDENDEEKIYRYDTVVATFALLHTGLKDEDR